MTLPALPQVVRGTSARFLLVSLLTWGGTVSVSADQVEMSNGDRYVGRVQSLNSDFLVLQSQLLGTLRLPRSKISTITLEARAASASSMNPTQPSSSVARPKISLNSNAPGRVSSGMSTNASAADFSAAMQQLGANSNTLHQVQEQFLSGAGPEAQAKFNDLMGGLLSGKVDLAGLRAEARSTLDQAKKVRGDLGEEGGGMMDSYLAILDNFLKESEPQGGVTNSAVSNPAQANPRTPEDQ